MKAPLREIYGAPIRAAAEVGIDVFAEKYGAKYDKAVVGLTKDRQTLLIAGISTAGTQDSRLASTKGDSQTKRNN